MGAAGAALLRAWGRTSASSPGAPLPSSRGSAAGSLQSHFTDEETKAPEPPWEPCPGPSAVSGSDGTTLGASQGCAAWAGEGEGRRGAGAPETTAPGVLQGLGQGAPSRGAPGQEVWGVLVSSRPTQRATRCSCQDNRASPIPLGCRGAASGPWPQAQAPGTPGKGLPESGGPPHRGHLILSTHTCPSRCQRHRHWRAAGRAAGFLSATESAFTHPLLCRTGPACNRRRRGDPETERDVETQTLATCTLNTHT